MRVLWIAPWGRPLARVYLDELVGRGHDVRLVTTIHHHEQWTEPADYELFVHGSFRQASSWPSLVAVVREARRFRPDVVVTEEFNDPRLLALLDSAPHVTLIHDDAAHDATEVDRWYHQRVYRRVARTAAALVTFSEFVGRAVAARTSTPVATVPLPSDAGEHLVPPFVPASARRDVVLIGRINPYKNLPGTFEAWARHVASEAYRGDRLLVIGDGNEDELTLPPACEWRRGRFQFADLMPVLAVAKASLAYYTTASQSGVQVLAMQCGTAALVADIGGLAEYLPPGERPIPVDAPAALATALDRIADPAVAADRGRAGRLYYERRFAPPAAADALLDVLDRVRSGASSRSGAGR